MLLRDNTRNVACVNQPLSPERSSPISPYWLVYQVYKDPDRTEMNEDLAHSDLISTLGLGLRI